MARARDLSMQLRTGGARARRLNGRRRRRGSPLPRPVLVRIRAQLYTREKASASACCRRVHLIWNGAADERADRAGHRLRCRGGDRLCSRSVRRDAQLLPDFMRSHQSDSHSHFHTFSPPSLTFLFEYIFVLPVGLYAWAQPNAARRGSLYCTSRPLTTCETTRALHPADDWPRFARQ